MVRRKILWKKQRKNNDFNIVFEKLFKTKINPTIKLYIIYVYNTRKSTQKDTPPHPHTHMHSIHIYQPLPSSRILHKVNF